MTVTVQLLAMLRDRAGAAAVDVVVGGEPTVANLRDAVGKALPGCADLIARSAVAVNHAYAKDDLLIQPGDEVAVIPPVSGGSR
jgi:molybdopterin converting factor small subunit